MEEVTKEIVKASKSMVVLLQSNGSKIVRVRKGRCICNLKTKHPTSWC